MNRIILATLCLLTILSPVSSAEFAPVPVRPPMEAVQSPRAPMQPSTGTTARLLSPAGPVYSMGMPSLQRPPLYGQQGHHRQSVPQPPSSQGWTGYGFGGVPTYQWGYFGARYRPVKVYHRGYYGHRMSYGYRRGY